MFQGNPFETELVVHDRTTHVRQDVESSQVPHQTQGYRRVRQRWQSLMAAIRTPRHSAPNLEPLKDRR